MTNQEWESRMVELRDAQLVTQRTLDQLAERQDNTQRVLDKLAERHDKDITELRDAQVATQIMLEKSAERHDNEIAQLRDSQLVIQRLMELNEKKWDARFERWTTVVEQLRSNHESDVAELRAAIASLITNIDRLIQGRQPDGH